MTIHDTVGRLAAGLALVTLGVTAAAQSISVKGSDTMLPLGQGWASAYMKAKPGRIVTVTGGGSTTGMAGLINGICDIAQASRAMKGSELDKAKARGFVPFEAPAARDGLAIIVNPKNPLTKITMAQLKGLFGGSISNWKAVGGGAQAVVTVGRDSSSGTYGGFQDSVLGVGRPYRPDMQTSPSNNYIGQVVSQDEGAIGYIGIAYARRFGSKVKVLPVGKGAGPGVEPTEENVRSGKYPLSRYLFFYTRGKPAGAAKDFIDWVRGPEGQAVVAQVGYYKIN
ncbi:MAG: phosphate ABC transporter substrate-binding protein [Armatimonadetes bacterium]|nr:phosphate ABC transporter substrate-binding protein [Armatimonadota bacterium]